MRLRAIATTFARSTVRGALIVACACHGPRGPQPAPAWRDAPCTVELTREARPPSDRALLVPADLRATSGSIVPAGEGWRVDAGAMRALAPSSSGDAAELTFVHHGPSREARPLASGELRRQIGLKLRARDTCNVLYVMWEIEPAPRVVVSMKRNPGRSTHAACGAGGYTRLTPRARATPPPAVHRGERHVLRAEIAGGALRVEADGHPVWDGDLPPEALALHGPAGIRTDNGAFDFVLRAAVDVTAMAPRTVCAP